MSDTKSFKCPDCGASLMPDGYSKEVKCTYCGSTVIVPEELRNDELTDDGFEKAEFDDTNPGHVSWLIKNGADVTAKVDHINDYSGNMTDVRIHLSGKKADGRKFEGQAYLRVPPLPAVPRQGAMLKVKYDRSDDTNFAIQIDGQFYNHFIHKGETGAPTQPTEVPRGVADTKTGLTAADGQPLNPQLEAAILKQGKYYKQLCQTGIEAKAVVLTSSNMNIREEGVAWVYDITFDITAPSGEHFQSRTQAAVMDRVAHKFAVGKLAIVRFDPKNKAQCSLVHAAEC